MLAYYRMSSLRKSQAGKGGYLLVRKNRVKSLPQITTQDLMIRRMKVTLEVRTRLLIAATRGRCKHYWRKFKIIND